MEGFGGGAGAAPPRVCEKKRGSRGQSPLAGGLGGGAPQVGAQERGVGGAAAPPKEISIFKAQFNFLILQYNPSGERRLRAKGD